MSDANNPMNKERIAQLETNRKDSRCRMDIEEVIDDLKSYIDKTKADILKWQFGMWFTAMAIILAAIWRFGG